MDSHDPAAITSILTTLPVALYAAPVPGAAAAPGDGVFPGPELRGIFGPDAPRDFNELLRSRIHPDDRALAEEQIAAAMNGRGAYFIECRLRLPDGGQYAWVLLEGRFTYDDAGRPLRHTGIVINAAGYFQHERRLRENAERYRKITETVSDYVYTVRVKNGVAVETIHGGACEAVTGYSPADFTRNPNLWIEMVHELDRPLVAARAQRMLRGDAVERLEHRIIHRNGQVRWVLSTIVPHRDESGDIVFFDGVIRDITKEKQEAETAKQRHYMNEILLNSVPYASVLLDEDGEVIAVNSQGGLIGFRPNTNWVDAWNALSGSSSTELLDLAFAKGERQQLEISNRGRYYETTFVPMEPDLCLVCFYDISKRKNFEKAMNSSKLLTDAIINSSRAYVTVVNADLTVSAVNAMTEKLINRTADEVKGKNISEVFAPDKAADCAAKVRETVASGVAGNFRDKFGDRYMDTDVLPVFAGGQGQGEVVKVLFFTRDYSERRRVELNLLEAYQTLTAVVEHAPVAIATFGSGGEVRTWNPASVELFGWQPADVCGKPSFWLDDTPGIADTRARLAAGGSVKQTPVSVRCADGTARPGLLTGTALMNGNGEISGYLSIIERP